MICICFDWSALPPRAYFSRDVRTLWTALRAMEDEQLWTGYVRSSRYEVQVDSEGWAAAAAQSLEHNGFCVLRSPGRDRRAPRGRGVRGARCTAQPRHWGQTGRSPGAVEARGDEGARGGAEGREEAREYKNWCPRGGVIIYS